MPVPWSRSARQVQRTRRVADVLLRHGLGYVAGQLGLAVPRLNGHSADAPDHLPARVRAALTELGPTYVKLGQMLSTRADILPPDWVAELALLQDQVPPFSGEVARAQIEQELKAPVAGLFRRFEPEPFAAASIGQVHRAELMTGEEVVVKVQRPGIAEEMIADLAVLREMAHLAEGRTAWGKVYSFEAVVEQFGQELLAQLDFTVEGRHAERVAAAMLGDPAVLVPDVYWTYTTARVLTLEYIEGTPLNQVIAGKPAPEGRRRLAIVLVTAVLRQAFRDGVYHADPHPGNLLLTPDARLALMDFGLVGFLGETTRSALASLAFGLARRDAEEVTLALQDLGVTSRPVPQRQLQREIQYLLYRYSDLPLGEIPFTRTVQEILALAVKFGLKLPPELGQFVRTLLTLEGVVGQLDPGLSLVELAQPVVEELRQERFSVEDVLGDLRHNTLLAARQLDQLPARVRAFLQRLEGGQLPVIVEQGDFEHNLRDIGRLVNRVAAAIIAASALLLAGLLLGMHVGPSWAGMSILGLLVLALGGAGVLWLWLAILRSGRL
ncbi:MAG TPA: AarF/ABC1/UbiB kinase family protein [Anaerolineae bacterium]